MKNVGGCPNGSSLSGPAADGALYAFGRNSNGQLGLGNTEDTTSPQRVTALQVRQSGCTRPCLQLYVPLHGSSMCLCWHAPGASDPHKGSVRKHLIPVSTMIDDVGLTTQGHKVTTVSCGAEHSVVATDAGEVGFANSDQQAMCSTTGIVHCAV